MANTLTMPLIGTLPTDTSYYTLIAKKGDKGDKGDQGIQGIKGDIGEVSQEDLDIALDLKVDKITGKGLSTNDYTTHTHGLITQIRAVGVHGQGLTHKKE